MAAIVILAGIVVPKLAQARQKAHRIRCISHLKNIGLANRIFATDNSDKFPYRFYSNRIDSATLTTAMYYSWLSNELSTPLILYCPADSARRAAKFWTNLHGTNISYFTSLNADETRPQSILAGDRNLILDGMPLPSGLARGTNIQTLAWGNDMHRGEGNVTMGDGSVQQFPSARLDALRTVLLDEGEWSLLVP